MNTPDHWEHRGDVLFRTFRFRDFTEAFAFMTKVAVLADEADHHPDWSNSWNVVHISLTTHSANSTVTERDIALAEAINSLFG
ncbi:MAG: 4a-hydroxytetrahydrobiopterin dehydratase [Ilumatobacteraceae bacterium]|jgi:4a-hydroxytetrahydrobiopterin dehydratase|nr:4a-hydroxytetrahydrobiopterin dehydratase [Ilumatobacteraceae bacterium]